MKVQIFSMMAAVSGNADVMWSGHVPDQVFDGENEAMAQCEILFRLFNRVDHPQDWQALENLGYRLPSMSVGDFVAFDGMTYQVQSVGFVKVTGNADFLGALYR